MAKPAHALPDDTQPRIMALVERSAPDPDRPRMREDIERCFYAVDRESAACYASAEDLSHRFRRSAEETDAIVLAWPPEPEE